jgi:hypothetical protein
MSLPDSVHKFISEWQARSRADADFGAPTNYSEIRLDTLSTKNVSSEFLREQQLLLDTTLSRHIRSQESSYGRRLLIPRHDGLRSTRKIDSTPSCILHVRMLIPHLSTRIEVSRICIYG